MKATMMRVELSINRFLDRAGTYFGDVEVASKMADKSMHRTNYREVRRRARQLAKALQDKAGIQRGEAVATLLWNHYIHLECYFGIPAAGAVIHTLNLRLGAEELAYIMEDAEDRVLVVDDVMLPLWEQVKPLLKRAITVIVVPYAGLPVPAEYDSYEEFIDLDASAYAYPDQLEDEPMAMCYTSGTTGHPKGVVYSHRSMVLHSIIACSPHYMSVMNTDTVLVVTPMFHANAWSIPYLAAMVGAKQVLPGVNMRPDDLLDMLEQEAASIALGVPTIWHMILDALESGRKQWTLKSGLRMLVGGAAVSEDLISRFDKHDLVVMQGWGMTETSPLGAFSWLKRGMESLPEEKKIALRATQGLPPPLIDMRVVSDSGESLPWDGKSFGELQLRGPWVAGSYHNVADTAEKFSEDGWLRTGDVAFIDSEGYMKIVDRSKDLIKSGGEWISSVDLEKIIMACPNIADVAVIGIRHPKWDERPLAVVVPVPGTVVVVENLRAALLSRMPGWQVPDDYVIVDSLPRTATGKVMKFRLREQFKDMASVTK